METKHIEYVVELARTGSLTQAAANLNVAQPSISQAITALERHFGITLFDRTSRPVQPTPAGRTFIEQSQRILDEVRRLHGVAAEHSSLFRGRLTIGTTFWVGEAILPALLVDFHALFPGITFVLRREPSGKLIDYVRSGEHDVAFTDVPKSARLAGLVSHSFDVDEIVLAVPPTHELASRASVRLAELGNQPFVAHEIDSSIFESFNQEAKASGSILNVVASAQGQILRSLVSQGLGISVGSRRFFDGPGFPVKTISLVPPMTRKTSLVYREADIKNATRPFVDYISKRLAFVA
jgi:DNA-binding transcriptional LysR family regulator